jgi:hypothetical protein
MKNIEKIAEELFNKIRSRFSPLVTKTGSKDDQPNEDTNVPSKARQFIFPYTSSDGTKHGELVISLIDETSLKLTFSQGIEEEFSPEQEREWEDFLRNMRYFARRSLLMFDIRDISRSNLTPRDLEQTVKQKMSQNQVREGIEWSGTTRTSVQNFGPTRLIVRHSEAVDQTRPGSRSRKVESIFVETDQGERFRMPFNKLSLGRAMAQHLAHGGRIYDQAGENIVGMAEEMSNLAFFVRTTRNRQFEDRETQSMVETAVERYRGLKTQLERLGRTRNYQDWAESFSPVSHDDLNYDIDELKERFVKRMIDDRLTAALPYVYRAYQNRQMGEQRYIREFEAWANNPVSEDQMPDSQALSKIFARPLKAGLDGIDARAVLADVIDNEELNDLIQQAAEIEGPDTDVRPVIDEWLIDNYPEYTSLMPIEPEPVQVPKPEPSDLTTQPRVEDLRRLAGLQ